jgi:hypothetical protein
MNTIRSSIIMLASLALASPAIAADNTAPAPLSIKEKDIQHAEKLVVIAAACSPASGLSLFMYRWGKDGPFLKIALTYGHETGDQVEAVFGSKYDDLVAKMDTAKKTTIATRGVFATPDFDPCEEAKRWSEADIAAANKAWLAADAPRSPQP